jgi:hypothetical protein
MKKELNPSMNPKEDDCYLCIALSFLFLANLSR